jgi:hypothetical protein
MGMIALQRKPGFGKLIGRPDLSKKPKMILTRFSIA